MALSQQLGPSGPGIGVYSAIRNGDWKLIYYYTDGSLERFDINNDIGEQTNLAAKNPSITQALARELSAYLKKADAQLSMFTETNKVVPYPDESTETIIETSWAR